MIACGTEDASLRLAAASFKSAVAQRAVVLAAQVADLVQQRPGDRAVELGSSPDGAQQVAAVEHDRAVRTRSAPSPGAAAAASRRRALDARRLLPRPA